MNKVKTSVKAAMILLLLVGTACTEEKEKEENSDKENTEQKKSEQADETEITEKEVVEVNQFEEDWNNIKKAINEGDIQALGAFAGSDAVDSELLINLIQENSFVTQVMDSYEFEHLKTDEQEDGTYLMFTSYSQQNEEAKKTLSIYLMKGEENLTIEYFIAENLD